MILSFHDEGTEDIYEGIDSRKARNTCPSRLWRIARNKLDLVDSAEDLIDLKSPPGNQLEQLKGDRAGQWSIRINRQYRICFSWTSRGPVNVQIVDYH